MAINGSNDDLRENGLDYYVGNAQAFYGVCGNRFKLGNVVFEAKEDPNDGYRSMLGAIEVVEDRDDIFFKTPIASVEVEELDDESSDFVGYRLVGAYDRHVWLLLGTDYRDNWYPVFVFRYTPQEEKIKPAAVAEREVDAWDVFFTERGD